MLSLLPGMALGEQLGAAGLVLFGAGCLGLVVWAL